MSGPFLLGALGVGKKQHPRINHGACRDDRNRFQSLLFVTVAGQFRSRSCPAGQQEARADQLTCCPDFCKSARPKEKPVSNVQKDIRRVRQANGACEIRVGYATSRLKQTELNLRTVRSSAGAHIFCLHSSSHNSKPPNTCGSSLKEDEEVRNWRNVSADSEDAVLKWAMPYRAVGGWIYGPQDLQNRR